MQFMKIYNTLPQLYCNKSTQIAQKQQNNSVNNISSNATITPSFYPVYFGGNIIKPVSQKEIYLGVINDVKKGIEANNPAEIKALAKQLAELNNKLSYIPDTKSNLYNEFGKIFTEEHIKPVAALLDNHSAKVRKDSIEALSIMQAESQIEKIVKKFKDEDVLVRESAVRAMGRIGGGKYLENLKPMLFSNKPINKLMAINAVTDYGSADHVPLITSCMSDNDFSLVREAELRFFKQHGSEDHFDIIDDLASDGSMWLYGDARLAKSMIKVRKSVT